MPNTVFECGNEKCANAIDISDLNAVQLKALRMWKKTCPACGQLTHWHEKLSLLDTKTIQNPNGGQHNASLSKVNTKTASQKRKAARYTGH